MTTYQCAECGLPDPDHGHGDGLSSCDCTRCPWCNSPPGMCHCRNDGAGLTDIPDDDAAGWAGIDPRITAALTDPAVCGWLETSGGRPCNNCLSGIRIKLGKGFTVEQILDDIAHYRADNIARASL